MYSFLKGKVVSVEPKCIVLENNKIGYEIIVPNPYSFKISDDEIKVYTYYYVREDQALLYGFLSKEEKEMFLKLISVSGIGPKSALSILASASVSEILNAINNRNDIYLKKFPGIGAKASQQIILDLYGKVSFEDNTVLSNKHEEDITEALTTLGYAKKDISRVLKKIDMTQEDSKIIKEALKELNK